MWGPPLCSSCRVWWASTSIASIIIISSGPWCASRERSPPTSTAMNSFPRPPSAWPMIGCSPIGPSGPTGVCSHFAPGGHDLRVRGRNGALLVGEKPEHCRLFLAVRDLVHLPGAVHHPTIAHATPRSLTLRSTHSIKEDQCLIKSIDTMNCAPC